MVVKDFATRPDRLRSHVSKMLRQTYHLGTLVSAFFDQPRASFEILLDVIGGAKLDQAHDAFEIILLRRE